MNMNKSGTISANQRAKLLAGFVAIAMVVCVLFAVLPSSDAVDQETDPTTPVLKVTIGDEAKDYTYAELSDAIAAINAAEGNVTVDVLNDFTADLTGIGSTSAAIVLSNSNADAVITINGNNHTISGFSSDNNKVANMINIQYSAADFKISDLIIDGDALGYHGINIYSVTGTVTLDGVTVTDNNATGITLNMATNVVASDITATNNAWGAINVDNGSALEINGNNNLGDGFQIWSEDANTEGTGSSVTGDAFDDYQYRWDKTSDNPSQAVNNGAIWFANGTVTGDFVLGGGNNITIPADKTLTVASGASFTVQSGSTLAIEEGAKVTGNVINKGVQVETDPETGEVIATVADFASLQAAVANSSVEKIVLNADITFTDHLNSGTKKIDLNGFDMTLGTYTLNAYSGGAGAVTVPNGSTFSFSGMVKIAENGLATDAGSKIVYASSTASFYKTGSGSTPSDSDKFYPLFAEGAMITYQGYVYTNFYYDYYGETVQYGLTHTPVYYNENRETVTEMDIKAMVKVFDQDFTAIVLDWTLGEGPYKDVKTYEDAIQVLVSISSTNGESVSSREYIPLIISPLDLTDLADVTVEEPVYYDDGNQVKPGVTVTYNGTTLTKGADYELTYGENKAETGTVTIQFIGNYTGKVTEDFEILEEYTNLEITTQPTKTDYYVGEKVDLSGMVVEATKESDTGTVEIPAYDPKKPDTPGYIVDIEYVSADTAEIVIKYVNASGETLTASVPIEVTQIESITVADVGTGQNVYDKAYSVGESINVNNMKVTVTYTDDKTVVFNGSENGFTMDQGSSGTFSTEITFDPETFMATGAKIEVTPIYFGFEGTTFPVEVTGGLAQYVYDVGEERFTYATQAGADHDNIAVYGFANDYAPAGQEFVGWNVEGTGVIYQPGDMIEVNGDSNMWKNGVITLVAVFDYVTGGEQQPSTPATTVYIGIVKDDDNSRFVITLVGEDGAVPTGAMNITINYLVWNETLGMYIQSLTPITVEVPISAGQQIVKVPVDNVEMGLINNIVVSFGTVDAENSAIYEVDLTQA